MGNSFKVQITFLIFFLFCILAPLLQTCCPEQRAKSPITKTHHCLPDLISLYFCKCEQTPELKQHLSVFGLCPEGGGYICKCIVAHGIHRVLHAVSNMCLQVALCRSWNEEEFHLCTVRKWFSETICNYFICIFKDKISYKNVNLTQFEVNSTILYVYIYKKRRQNMYLHHSKIM